LPSYACPVFVRLCAVLDNTETFKQKKQDLVRAGFDPRTVADTLFFRDTKSGNFLPLDANHFALLSEGAIRL
jgi:fatty-acyl-CoA synthase